jgi:phosphatidylserine/phosphatidylglycerophosphate/cardiolipin synthase-like enzyme
VGSLRDLSRADLLRLAEGLESGKLVPGYAGSSVTRYVGYSGRDVAAAELRRLDGLGMSPQHIAVTARLLAEEREAAQAIRDRLDLVWTGPEVEGSLSRDSATVARELLGQAERSVLLASYVIDPNSAKAKALLGSLAERMDANTDLVVRLFINVARRKVNGVWDDRDGEVLVGEVASTVRRVWPGKRMPKVFYDPRALAKGRGPRGCLHAKVFIVDGQRALVTSANLTEAAHERNIEAGVLISDEAVAAALERQFLSLVDEGLLVAMPGMG